MNRHLPLEGVDNFRDFGGYAVSGGRRLKRGMLYRSASHSRATERDLEHLAALDIAVVVDLRSRDERVREPSRRPRAFAGVVIEAENEAEEEEDGWRRHIMSSELSASSFRAYLMDYYRNAPFEPRHIGLFSRYFERLSESKGPVLVHCAAGKDRTGVLAALTHHVAGVHPNDITADYLLTNDPARVAARLPQVTQAIHELSGRTPDEDAVRTIMGVDAAYLDTALGEIKRRFGGTDAYLTEVLGVTPERKEAITSHLVE